MQSELFNNMFGISVYSFRYTGPLRGSHDADVALGGHEFDAPAIQDAETWAMSTDLIPVHY